MTPRVMYDCMGVNAAQLAAQFPAAELVAWYGTGSPDIQWTPDDLARFPHSVKIEIDQGFTGSPVMAATVRDVEAGAWTVAAAVDLAEWTAERPTIYCNRSTLGMVIAEGWRGDVWLAWPGYSASGPPVYNGVNIVAVQSGWGGYYDSSLVYDPAWPQVDQKPPGAAHLSLTLTGRTADLAWTVIPGATGYQVTYHAAPGTVAVALARADQPALGGAVHMGALTIPGGRGGSVQVWAQVGAVLVDAGLVTLP